MSNKDIEQLRALILSERRENKGPFSKGLRERLNNFLKARFQEGEPLKRVGAQLGLSHATVQYWKARWGEQNKPGAKLRRVEVVSEEAVASRTVTLQGPAGTRIDGLSLDEVAALWRKLS